MPKTELKNREGEISGIFIRINPSCTSPWWLPLAAFPMRQNRFRSTSTAVPPVIIISKSRAVCPASQDLTAHQNKHTRSNFNPRAFYGIRFRRLGHTSRDPRRTFQITTSEPSLALLSVTTLMKYHLYSGQARVFAHTVIPHPTITKPHTTITNS